MVNGLPLYNALLVFWPLKALHTTNQIHPIHTLTQGPTQMEQQSGLI